MARILVVDDESSMRFLLRMAFEHAGHEVDEAPNGQAAVEAIENGPVPDLVATDLMMPLLNGHELIARLRASPETRRVPVILISASSGSERNAEADAFFGKPFDHEVLVQCAERLLGEAG